MSNTPQNGSGNSEANGDKPPRKFKRRGKKHRRRKFPPQTPNQTGGGNGPATVGLGTLLPGGPNQRDPAIPGTRGALKTIYQLLQHRDEEGKPIITPAQARAFIAAPVGIAIRAANIAAATTTDAAEAEGDPRRIHDPKGDLFFKFARVNAGSTRTALACIRTEQAGKVTDTESQLNLSQAEAVAALTERLERELSVRNIAIPEIVLDEPEGDDERGHEAGQD